MRFALHSWCIPEYLKQANEIIVFYEDKKKILDYPIQYPEASITIQCFNTTEIDWGWLIEMAPQFPKGFSVGVISHEMINKGISLGLKMYLLKPINNFLELSYLKDLGVCYIYLDQPLFSTLSKVDRFEIPVRWMPNIIDSSPGYLKRYAHGTWIRPEDLILYEEMIAGSIVEFNNVEDHRAEQAYYRIYAQDKVWPQHLDYLYPELKGQRINNYLIDDGLTEKRLNCRQRCEEYPNGNGCHACDLVFANANIEKIEKFIETRNKESN